MIPHRIFREDFPHVTRFIVTKDCNFDCRFPNGDFPFCHKEGIGSQHKNPSLVNIVKVSRRIRDYSGIDSIRLGGLEPTSRTDIVEIVSALHNNHFEKISLSTNGSNLSRLVTRLKKAGLKRINISLNSLDPKRYHEFTGRGNLGDVLVGIKESIENGLEVKISHVLLKGYDKDFHSFIHLVEKERLTGKINVLLWTKENNAVFKEYYTDWSEYWNLFQRKSSHLSITRYKIPQKSRVVFYLSKGGQIQADLFYPKKDSCPPVCHKCKFNLMCQEGFLGCGVRVLPDLNLSPCLLGEFNISLKELCQLTKEFQTSSPHARGT